MKRLLTGLLLLLALPLVAIAQNPVVRTADAAANNGVLIGNSTPAWIRKTLPSCSNATTSKLLYNNSTNEFSCGTDQDGGGGSATSILLWFPIGNRAGSANTITSPWNSPTSGNATISLAGSDPTLEVLDFDATTDENVSLRWHLPPNYNSAGTTSVTFVGRAAATTGNVILAVETACIGDGESFSSPSFNAVQNATWTPSNPTGSARATVSLNLTMTGCAANEDFIMRLARDADNASDTMTGDFQMVGMAMLIPIS